MIQKTILVQDRVRHLPKTDWAWVERRFLRDFAPKLSGDAVFLYYILVAVSDKSGLSFYSDNSLARIVRTPLHRLVTARQELIDCELIAYQAPLAQVLSLPSNKVLIPKPTPEQELASSDSYQQLIALLAANAKMKNPPSLESPE